jgi:type IV secretory pathway TrbF-like protein
MGVLQRVFPRMAGRPAAADATPANSPAASAAPHNPYLAARKEWDERYGDLITRSRNWRVLALLLGVVAFVQAGGLIYLSSKSRVIPFVVAIDSLDRVVAAGPAQQSGVTDERLVRAALYEWIGDLRMVTTDGVNQRKAIDRVYSMIGSGTPAQVQIGEFYSKDPPASRAQRQTVAAEVKAVFSTSDKTYEVEWVETTRSLNGQVLSEENWKGSVTIAVNPPADERLARINPLGIYVVGVSWSRVL